MLVAYWDRRVTSYYVKDGRPTSEQDNIRQALRFVRRTYGQDTRAADFGPQALKLVRNAMIQAGRCRTLINKDVNRVRGLFRWATEEERYGGDAYQALRAVQGLSKGRGEARERPPVGMVSVAVVKATLPHLTGPLAALLELQLLTGMRPGEVVPACAPATSTGPTRPPGPIGLARTSSSTTAATGSSRSARAPRGSFVPGSTATPT